MDLKGHIVEMAKWLKGRKMVEASCGNEVTRNFKKEITQNLGQLELTPIMLSRFLNSENRES